jgi:hypothetical protein
METALMSNIGRKVAIAAAAFATVGSTVFGGAALAGDDPHQDARSGSASATNGDCFNVLSGNNVLSGIGAIIGAGKADANAPCNIATGTSGAGGVNVDD